MEHRRLVVVVLLVGLLVSGLLDLPNSFAAPPVSSSAEVLVIATGTVVGESTLLRLAAALSATLETTGLTSGNAYTMWWVIFNNPEFCSLSPCTAADFANANVQASQVLAAGHVAGGSGKAGFASYLAVGDTSEAVFGPGLLDPLGAEIHLVLRSHGRTIPGMVDDQISSLNGGCPPNTCTNVQVSRHLP
ncbi:MAG: hypothetical protein ACRERE_43595 [Candidatus Entotheonellia bacterium]